MMKIGYVPDGNRRRETKKSFRVLLLLNQWDLYGSDFHIAWDERNKMGTDNSNDIQLKNMHFQ